MADIIYKESASAKANELFKARESYKNYAFAGLPIWRVNDKVQPDRMRNAVEEKMLVHPFHGRVDSDGDAIYLVLPKLNDPTTNIKISNPKYTDLKTNPAFLNAIPERVSAITELKNTGKASGLYVPRFIAKAFFELNSYYKDGLLTGKLENNGVYSPLAPFKATVNFEVEYKKYFESLIKQFEQDIKFKKLEKDIISISDYIEVFMNHLLSKDKLVVTASKYILSRHVDPAISGLSLYITADDCNNDLNKFNTYIQNNNFNFFLESCTRFGFMVNADAPWELYFHFNSQPAKDYLNRYGVSDENDLYRQLYRKAFYRDIEFLKNCIIKHYNIFASRNKKIIFCKDLNRCGEPIIKSIERHATSVDKMDMLIKNEQWLKYYLGLRLKEESIDLKDQVKNGIVRDALTQSFSENGSLEYINRFILLNRETMDLRKIQSY